ncbi:MAG: aminotransferase class IV, partial [Clostridia bacterium]|nr:aminotransferase class IV [Clostridia bacterium]
CSLIGQEKAEKMGYSQVLWLDGIEHKYIDEVGAMNVFFVIDGKVITPALDTGSILPGVTRASCIQLLRNLGYTVEERKLSLAEVEEAYKNGKLDEAFGTGTAAVVSPMGLLDTEDMQMVINNGEIGKVAQTLYDTLTGIQWGKLPDDFGWTVKVN